MRLTKGWAAAGLIFMFACLAAGCGQDGQSGAWEQEEDWEEGQGNLPDSVGDPQSVDLSAEEKEFLSTYLYFDHGDDLWKKTDYGPPTGTWFFKDGKGSLGYGMPAGTMKSGGNFSVELIAHEEDSVAMEREIRVRLTEMEKTEEKEKVVDETVYVETAGSSEIVYSGNLPDNKNAGYLLSVEVINDEGEVEDTRLSFMYVPVPEMNASLRTDQETYTETDEEVKLILENAGPTYLFIGEYYSVEKKVGDTWRKVPLELAFNDIGLYVGIGEEHVDTVDMTDLDSGTYRLIKDMHTEGIDLSAELAAEFTIQE
ncbi:hypothetical protein K8O68_03875 [Salipaludibacillus sp. CUR1]|uniref:immunoglobulin-like domain-containing protein n=1 Tax=Salipaludibacillus sp. CUR1 TaxID=2820003 RepID=UPI001E41C9D4|nr:immunoglobulin-like domain-containing protein [Salipaludibacillus sp. CUR1]MCE7791564.1 hypothetical protein [Salipaludibacillus sp. CUR1]